MGSRMDKYNNSNIDDIPKRSDRNKDLYKRAYSEYDEFDFNLVTFEKEKTKIASKINTTSVLFISKRENFFIL